MSEYHSFLKTFHAFLKAKIILTSVKLEPPTNHDLFGNTEKYPAKFATIKIKTAEVLKLLPQKVYAHNSS